MAITARAYEKPTPWKMREYVYVDGFPLVYTGVGDTFLVRMPGKKAMTVKQLEAKGCIVEMPMEFRLEIPPKKDLFKP